MRTVQTQLRGLTAALCVSLVPYMTGFANVAHAGAVSLDVTFKLTDLDYKPLAGAPIRVVFGSDPDWQGGDAGHRFVTDSKGEARWTQEAVLTDRMRKHPTNFASSLVSAPQSTQYLRVGAEMTYFEKPWLYTEDLYRFPGGDTLLDSAAIYTRDDRGAFTRQAKQDKNGWTIDGLGGLVLTTPGIEAWDFALDPVSGDPSGRRWTLRLGFKKSPAPVRR
jgi:hypothetical protein